VPLALAMGVQNAAAQRNADKTQRRYPDPIGAPAYHFIMAGQLLCWIGLCLGARALPIEQRTKALFKLLRGFLRTAIAHSGKEVLVKPFPYVTVRKIVGVALLDRVEHAPAHFTADPQRIRKCCLML